MSSFSVRCRCGRRTRSDRVANAIRSGGGRNPPLKINILTTDSVVSSLRTLNFCGFRAFCGRTIRTLNFCDFRAFRGRTIRTLNFCGFRAFRGRTIRTLNFCGFRAFRGRTIRTLNFCGFRAFRGRTIRTLNFCGFRAFRGRTIRTLNFCGFRAFRGHSFFPRNSQNSQNLLLWVFPIKKEATTKTAVASFYISTESEALLHANLLEQALCVAPLIHEEEHVADVHTDAASQTLVEPDVA